VRGSKHKAAQEAAQQAEPDHYDQHEKQQKPGPKRLALDLVLGRAEVFVNALLVFGLQAAWHRHLE